MNALFNNKKLCSKIRGTIVCGASIGEEIPYFSELKIQNQIYIEPIQELFSILEQRSSQQFHKPKVQCFNLAVSDYDGIGDFYISTGSFCSSSLLPFAKEAVRYGLTLQESEKRQVEVKKLDTIINKFIPDIYNYNCLYIDVQGNEYNVIKGALKYLRSFDILFVEVNNVKLYEDVKLWHEFDELVKLFRFQLLNLRELEGSQNTQSEALYINKEFKF